jgi:hypothetical protein
MNLKIPWLPIVLYIVALGIIFAAFLPRETVVAAPPLQERQPWEIPDDAGVALNEPDQFAWELFLALNWPADIPNKTADSTQPFGKPDVPVTWQTWKLQVELFRHDGIDPGAWDEIPSYIEGALDEAVCFPLQQTTFLEAGAIPCEPHLDLAFQEVRVNRATWDFVRDNELYYIEGLIKAYELGKPIKFVTDSIEIKVVWRPISEENKSRYLWIDNIVTSTVPVSTSNGITETVVTTTTIWGMTGMHITSRVLPNWFWATFEHLDNPYRLPLKSDDIPVNEPWYTPSRDEFACPEPPYDCNLPPDSVDGVSLKGTFWENYVLRGTQTDFVDSYGNPTRLANSEIETGFQLGASCITCHSLAVIGPEQPGARRLASINFLDPLSLAPGPRSTLNGGGGYLGAPDPKLFQVPGDLTQRFLQTDFLWSVPICANWRNPPRQDPLPGEPAPPRRGPNCGYPPGEAPHK